MKKIHIISAGGTFNKVFDPKKDKLVLENESKALKEISTKEFCAFNITNIEEHSNTELLESEIKASNNDYILIICDLSNIDSTVKHLNVEEKYIVFMDTNIPYDVDPIAATAILCSVYGQMIMMQEEGMYIVKNGLILES